MENAQKAKLRQHHVEIAEDLEPKEVLDHLNQDGVLTDNDCEMVATGKTRKERCQLLLSLLPRRGPNAYGAFTRALGEARYEHIQAVLVPEDSGSQSEETERKERADIGDETRRKDVSCGSESGSTTMSSANGNIDEASNPRRGASEEKRKCHSNTALPCDKCRPILAELSDDGQFSRFLLGNCCLFFGSIEPIDLIDHHYQDGVLSEDEYERVRAGVTRKDRCKTLISELAKRPADGVMASLKKSLEKKYSFVLDNIKNDFCPDEEKRQNDSSSIRQQVNEKSQNTTNTHIAAQTFESIQLRPAENVDGSKLLTDGAAVAGISKSQSYRLEVNKASKATRHRRINQPQPCCDTTDSDDNKQIQARRQDRLRRRKERHRGGQISDDKIITESLPDLDTFIFLQTPGSSSAGGSVPGKRLSVAFNYLSTLINQGQYDKFESVSSNLKKIHRCDPDMTCLLAYLHASRDLFKNEFDAAKRHIDNAFQIVPKTSDPKYFTVELFTAKTRMYITQKRIEKLEGALDDVKQIIETDPCGCTGRAAGWLYMNDGRCKTSQMTCLNPFSPHFLAVHGQMRSMAKESFQRALENFQRDGGKDGPFGCGYAICRLCILLLQCGDNGLTMNTIHPSEEDIKTAGAYIQRLEDSSIPIPKILEVHLLLGKSDYQFRRGNAVRALEHAENALRLATELNMLEFTEHARNRVMFLKTRTPLEIRDVTDEEAMKVLFEKNCDLVDVVSE